MIHLDTYHANIEEKSFADALADGAGRVRYVHLSESDRGVPGSSNVHWRSVMTALKGSHFSGDLVMECFVTSMPQLAAALSVWRPVASGAEEVMKIGVPYLSSLAPGRAASSPPEPSRMRPVVGNDYICTDGRRARALPYDRQPSSGRASPVIQWARSDRNSSQQKAPCAYSLKQHLQRAPLS